VLSDRQSEIVALIAEHGAIYDVIADELDLSPSTVKSVVDRLCNRFRCAPADLPRRVQERGAEA
jgi:DNA-binding CsgD family transcriptional regulator